MIISNIIGGLGNQMFQYARGRSLALDTGLELRLCTDQFIGYKLHQGLELSRVFALDLQTADAADLRHCLGAWRSPLAVRRLLGRLGWPLPIGRRFIAEANFEAGAYLHGYWQSERWFAHHKTVLRSDFSWRLPLQGRSLDIEREILATARPISVHIRRGDYVNSAKNQGVYAQCTPQYFEAAISRLRDAGADRVFAFSDDPAWVTTVLAPRVGNLVLVDHNRGENSHVDMRLMSLCRDHVIANSSFSWWGAWLDARPDKRVIAPMQWYVNGTKSDDLTPFSWERL
jgi:hypothetical protein